MSSQLETLRAAFPDNPPEREVEGRYRGDWLMTAAADVNPLGLFRPRSTEEVSRMLALCHARGIPVIPQGGCTGLTGGTVPSEGALLLSLERMAAVEGIDRVSHNITVQAGTPLQRVQEAAEAAGLMFPLDIGSRGSCQIGGNLSTNAGGNKVLRYGMARNLVLGLEVVLADGTILNSMNRMLKNNAGYDLKQVFIGSEGTLGIITRAVLRLVAQPRSMALAMAGFEDYPQCERFLAATHARLGDALSAFEVMWPDFYDRASVRKSFPPPLAKGMGAYCLIEMSVSSDDADAQLAAFIGDAIEQGLVADAVLAQSVQQTRQLWSIRDMGGELIRAYDPVGNFDISVPTAGIQAFVTDCRARLESGWPGVETIFFGHVVDGNIHLIAGGFGPDQLEPVELAVYEAARDHGGSISAEHGIGLHKRDHLHLSRTAEEIALMRAMKAALDPKGILNPGKVLA
jgi:FAD/FMN-containing dehydrogenase